ncbi:MAG: rRNA maturation RNase YbeY [Candidatus Magasanikbacteria bacterium RIFCSPLOWO2_02_FULL_44_11]|uniref:Endoribonuclease YbeY n=2 Tax=Candidatus Magasanikiibacteriota TaxID=1752731 RepID=A0A1F6N963_9BACT|nr:MAG: rRNA maturation RNase YbeY [Candidatus Magasanikbacteria bacterium RIFCSPHIGHO2_02_FULL_45_10]OGH80472.1 MAG: rRNA maturation RNase YbeY [Candidatus Magasanikbacteria bacterium RIFCSPLOWO2_02_FULL_44_11]
MISVDYVKNVDCPFSAGDVQIVLKKAAAYEPKIKGVVEVVVVGDGEIRQINKQFRGKDAVTDVLSFAWKDGGVLSNDLLGQIYISYPQIKRQSKSFECSPPEEFIRMLAHGILHIVGYDHLTKKEADRMFSLQEKILASSLNLLSL